MLGKGGKLLSARSICVATHNSTYYERIFSTRHMPNFCALNLTQNYHLPGFTSGPLQLHTLNAHYYWAYQTRQQRAVYVRMQNQCVERFHQHFLQFKAHYLVGSINHAFCFSQVCVYVCVCVCVGGWKQWQPTVWSTLRHRWRSAHRALEQSWSNYFTMRPPLTQPHRPLHDITVSC